MVKLVSDTHAYLNWNLAEETSNFFTIDIITFLIALWGAILSTIKVLFDHSRDTRKIKVNVAYGFMTGRHTLGPTVIAIKAVNIGHKNVVLNSVGFILPDKKLSIMIETQGVQLPHTLPEGNSCSVWKTLEQLAAELRKNGYSGEIKLRGYYVSAIGKTFKSKPIKFNMNLIFQT